MATFNGTSGNDLFTGTAGADTFKGLAGKDTLDGGGGDDSIDGGSGDDSLIAGSGVDTVEGGAGNDTLDLPGERNTYAVTRPAGFDLRLVRVATGEDISVKNVEYFVFNMVFYWAGDVIVPGTGGSSTGTVLADILDGRVINGVDQNDTIDGLAGNDLISGFGGNDSLLGNDGDDILQPGSGVDTVDGGNGFDVLRFFGSRPADFSVIWNGGFTVRLVRASESVDVSLRNIEAVDFGDGPRALGNVVADNMATLFPELLSGTLASDTLDGSSGNDTIDGLAGNDLLKGGADDDVLIGGSGIDIADYRGAAAVTANLATGVAAQGRDTDTLISIEALFGSSAADVLRGLDGVGNPGETLRGNGGNDSLDGGTGIDTAEFSGMLADYTITRAPGSMNITVAHNNAGADGTDALMNIEHLVFADRIVAFGPRAEEVARVAFALWSPAIYVSQTLFSKGISFYDNEFNYGFDFLCQVALQYHPETGAALAAKLKTNIPAISYSAAQLLDIMTANGGGDSIAGRTAAVKAVALDNATNQQLELTGVTTKGVVATLKFDAEVYFGLLPG